MTTEAHCHIPVRIRITGIPDDDQLSQLATAVQEAVAQRIAFADRTIRAASAGGHLLSGTIAGGGHPVSGPAGVLEPYNPDRELQDPLRYTIPSYQGAGRQRPMPAVFYDRDKGPFRPRSKSFYFQGVEMTTDPDYQLRELKLLVSRFGIRGLELWYDVLKGRRATHNIPFSAHARAFGGLRVRTPADLQRDIDNDAVRGEIGAERGRGCRYCLSRRSC